MYKCWANFSANRECVIFSVTSVYFFNVKITHIDDSNFMTKSFLFSVYSFLFLNKQLIYRCIKEYTRIMTLSLCMFSIIDQEQHTSLAFRLLQDISYHICCHWGTWFHNEFNVLNGFKPVSVHISEANPTRLDIFCCTGTKSSAPVSHGSITI